LPEWHSANVVERFKIRKRSSVAIEIIEHRVLEPRRVQFGTALRIHIYDKLKLVN
jgi:hypothetical protein